MASRYRFLLTPRWIGLILGVAAAVVCFSLLADWQLSRNSERGAENARIEAGLNAEPRPAHRVLSVERPVATGADGLEWRPVTASGRYDADHQLLIRYRPMNGNPGYHVLTPLVTDSGTALLVDRGWIPATADPDLRPPKPPNGRITATGRVRAGDPGDPIETDPSSGRIRYVRIPALADWLPYPVLDGYVELTAQNPQPTEDDPELVPEPELDPGPFLSYGVQWYLFGLIALVGLVILARDEAGDGRLRRRWSRST